MKSSKKRRSGNVHKGGTLVCQERAGHVSRPKCPRQHYAKQTRAMLCGMHSTGHVRFSFTGGGGESIEPPKTGGGGREKGSIDRHH